jgi:hypothetical protein
MPDRYREQRGEVGILASWFSDIVYVNVGCGQPGGTEKDGNNGSSHHR